MNPRVRLSLCSSLTFLIVTRLGHGTTFSVVLPDAGLTKTNDQDGLIEPPPLSSHP
jgi:hypothetical protein